MGIFHRKPRKWRPALKAMRIGLAGLLARRKAGTRLELRKKQGPTGSRLIGVASVCFPGRASQDELEAMVNAAARLGPDLIVLTETCMYNTPVSASRGEKDLRSDPLPRFGPISEILARRASHHRAYIMAGYWRRDANGFGRYNSAVLFDRQGRLVGFYDKMHPTIGELQDGVLPGREAAVSDTDFGRLGALICFDLNYADVLDQYKKKGAELLCFLSLFPGGELLRHAALRNRCYVVSAVPGKKGMLVDPLGRTLAESGRIRRIVFARVNLDCRVVHLDFNAERIRRLKRKYGRRVRIDVSSLEATCLLTSLHPKVSAGDMAAEFDIETIDAYLDRAARERGRHLL
ncbi:MAG: carbon-nitrogen hydrolase family protein [Candidatus Aminicenantes bacterium]|nr:carbon-nitrogen hydrolase family protein [Candidatus Aminicenantes bacterium]